MHSLPRGLLDALPELKSQLDGAKRDLMNATQRVKELTDLIASIERVAGKSSVPSGPAVLVSDTAFADMRATDAVRRVLHANPRAFKVTELADILIRGGQANDLHKTRQNVASALKELRAKGLLQRSEVDPTAWALNASGRAALAPATGPEEELLFKTSGEG